MFSAPPTPNRPCFDQGTEWGGVCFAAYSVVCFAVAFALPRFAARIGRRATHASGTGLRRAWACCRSIVMHNPHTLLLTMVGVGIAWASILSLPYAILAGSIPAARTGLYMGIFNFFIVLPEIIASLTFQPLVKHVFGNDPLYVVMLGGACLLAAAGFALRITDPADLPVRAEARERILAM